MFLAELSLSGNIALPRIFLMKDTHLEGFSVKSRSEHRSEQRSSIAWRAAAWSFIEAENTERFSANATLCVLERLVFVMITRGWATDNTVTVYTCLVDFILL